METRRIRRLERRRLRRTAVTATSVALVGVAIGMTLPHSTAASVAVLGVAAGCLVLVAARGDAVAPLHGLRRVVRLPFAPSVSASFESLRSRVAGSVGAVVRLRPRPTPLVLDEPDDEADEWWGVRPIATVPPAAAPELDAPVELPAAVVATPLASAQVPDHPGRGHHGLDQRAAAVRRLFAVLRRDGKGSDRDAGVHVRRESGTAV
jgi:hypothetical protein